MPLRFNNLPIWMVFQEQSLSSSVYPFSLKQYPILQQIFSFTMHLITIKISFILTSIFPSQNPVSTLFIMLPIAIIFFMTILILSISMNLVVEKISFIIGSVIKKQLPVTIFLSLFPAPFIPLIFCVQESSISFRQIILPIPSIFEAIPIIVLAFSLGPVINKLSTITLFVSICQFSKTIEFVLSPLSLVNCSIFPSNLSLAMSLTVFPLTFINRQIDKLYFLLYFSNCIYLSCSLYKFFVFLSQTDR